MDYKKLAEEQKDYVIKMRRHFHRHPELSGKEEKTIARICEELSTMGIPYVNVPNGGVFGFIGDEKKGRTVLLRGDVDALPGKESPVNGGGLPKQVVSEVEGVAHICGHDCNAAMLLGAAKILKAHEDELEGRVVLMFERGEEGGGNLAWLLKWAFENNLKVDTSFGLHPFLDQPAGKISVVSGPTMAGALGFQVKILGVAGHGAEPSFCTSPIDCFVSMYETIQSLRMKHANPYDPMVFSVGQVHAGYVNNVIPGELSFGGSFRVHNFEDGLRVREQLVKAIEKTAEIYNCQVEYNVAVPSMVLVNDPACAEFTKDVMTGIYGPDILYHSMPMMGTESHAMTAKLWPGTYMFLGSLNEAKGLTAKNHHECFEPDEDIFPIGLAAHVGYAMEFLKRGPNTADRVYKGDLKEFYTKYNPRALAAYED